MSFHKMQAIDYLLKEFNAYSTGKIEGIPQYILVFKMNNELYTGDFVIENNHSYKVPNYNSDRATMKDLSKNDNPEIRKSFFDSNHDIYRYAQKADFHLARIISHVENSDIVEDSPKVIYNLRKFGSPEQLDFYFVADENLTAVSLIKIKE